jgi:ribosomal protein S18 acetylase RimI-like enzyme
VHDLLINPVFESLLFKDRHLGHGTEQVKYFEPEVSPFAGFRHGYAEGFKELHELLPSQSNILYANPDKISIPECWQLMHEIPGLQFVLHTVPEKLTRSLLPVPLNHSHIAEMVALATLTKPGPFSTKTIEFGNYFGFFENDKLVAMTGQRLHVHQYTEISAVCTHPDHLGKGYAHSLMQHQVELILSNNEIPFLHVRADNKRAIGIYERSGFTVSRNMNFYFLKKSSQA